MIPDTLNPEIHVTTIELQNEIKSTEIKKTDNISLTSVKIREIHIEENAEKHEKNAGIINFINVDTVVSNVQKHGINTAVTNIYGMEIGDTNFRKVVHGYPGNNKRGIYLKDYWVQSIAMPEGSSPLSYDSSRNSFVALVFTITLIMIVITACFVGYVNVTADLRNYFLHDGLPLLFVGMLGMLSLNYSIMLSRCARSYPFIIICLVLSVTFMTLIASFVTVLYKTDMILISLVATAITVLVCLVLAMTSFDFTKFMFYIITISLAFSAPVIVIGTMALTSGVKYKPLDFVMVVIGTILNCAVLSMQLQLILGGRAVEIREDEWALGAFMLYTSIFDIFLRILQLLGEATEDS